jgi:hypothetical protein
VALHPTSRIARLIDSLCDAAAVVIGARAQHPEAQVRWARGSTLFERNPQELRVSSGVSVGATLSVDSDLNVNGRNLV